MSFSTFLSLNFLSEYLSLNSQGKGYATEAAIGVIDYLFSDLKKHRITASVDPINIKSVALLERIGMRKEAHFNEKCIIFLAYAIIINIGKYVFR